MTVKIFYIVESEDPDKFLEKFKDYFNIEKDLGEIIDDNGIYISDEDRKKLPFEDIEKFSELSNCCSRLLEVSWTDNGFNFQGNLYSITDHDTKPLRIIDKIDTTKLSYDKKGEKGLLDNQKTPYQGYSYLPAFFYHKHDFKMFETSPNQEINYNELYNPEDCADEEYRCPICGREEKIIERDGWEIFCKTCQNSILVPYFRKYENLKYKNVRIMDRRNKKTVIIEFEEDTSSLGANEQMWKIEEGTVLEILNKLKRKRVGDKIKKKINQVNRASKLPKLYNFLGSTVKVNGEEIKPPYDYKLSGSNKGYEKYNIELSKCENILDFLIGGRFRKGVTIIILVFVIWNSIKILLLVV